MPQYLSPGVYVEEVPSGIQPIAGVGTSTAGFIGVFESAGVPVSKRVTEEIRVVAGELVYPLGQAEVLDVKSVLIDGADATALTVVTPRVTAGALDFAADPGALAGKAEIAVDYTIVKPVVETEEIALQAGVTRYTIGNKLVLEVDAVAVDGEPVEAAISIAGEDGTATLDLGAGGADLEGKSTLAVTFAHLKPTVVRGERLAVEPGRERYELASRPVLAVGEVLIDGEPATGAGREVSRDGGGRVLDFSRHPELVAGKRAIHVTYDYLGRDPGLLVPRARIHEEELGRGDGKRTSFTIAHPPALADGLRVFADGLRVSDARFDGYRTVTLEPAPAAGRRITAEYVTCGVAAGLAPPGEARLVTSYQEFERGFGPLSGVAGQRILAHAVHGFFNNGGTRCHVVRVATPAEVPQALRAFERIDEIALVAAPGQTDAAVVEALVGHCEGLGDRFAILDCPEDVGTEQDAAHLARLDARDPGAVVPRKSSYAAYYFPWIGVFDPPTKVADPASDGTVYVPPSGHLAGLYARVDHERGVFKAPANEGLRGVVALPVRISRAQQDGLNPGGVNVIREFDKSILVWGARTLGGDVNGEWKYVNVRRLLIYLEESIAAGTRWVVFEPNEPALWARITRNVTAFLTNVWRSGALLGKSPAEAFYVKCDQHTNPPEVRAAGQVVTEVGVAAVYPAEFVVFRIQQITGGSR